MTTATPEPADAGVDRPCRKCGRRIRLVRNAASGAFIPLDMVAPVFRVSGDSCRRDNESFVSHFATCPSANDFSGSKKATPRARPKAGA